MAYYVYILASDVRCTVYIGVTHDIARRAYEHRQSAVKGFTKRYAVKRLVHYELFGTALEAIQREKSLKRRRRDWKVNLIERDNPDWLDLIPGTRPGMTK
ncbi:GIY-YIG nuclease family protein [Oceanibaculum pacificum]|uniref:GIY-YIG nuclease family protein n=1 Tax=Oceanibaculum pacificum TaxID=580166 RepID=UPI000A041DCA|nr:GIY-YIG nuclease family protein [Oceanibaculum pacificum]